MWRCWWCLATLFIELSIRAWLFYGLLPTPSRAKLWRDLDCTLDPFLKLLHLLHLLPLPPLALLIRTCHTCTLIACVKDKTTLKGESFSKLLALIYDWWSLYSCHVRARKSGEVVVSIGKNYFAACWFFQRLKTFVKMSCNFCKLWLIMQLHTDNKSPFVNFRFWLLQIFCENAQPSLYKPAAFYYMK